MNCPQCGGAFSNVQGKAVLVCGFCGTEMRVPMTAVESMERSLAKKAAAEPTMNALMDKYADHLGNGRKSEAIIYYESFTFVVVSLAYEVDDLSELEAFVVPLMKDAARQIGVEYLSPRQRGDVVTTASVGALAFGAV